MRVDAMAEIGSLPAVSRALRPGCARRHFINTDSVARRALVSR